MTEFVIWFKDQTRLLHERVQAIGSDEKFLAFGDQLKTLVERLPDDPVAFAWVVTHYHYDLKHAFIVLKHRFSVLHVKWKMGRYRQQHIEDLAGYMALFYAAYEQCTSLYKTLVTFIKGQTRLYEGQRLLKDHTIAPQRLITTLTPLLQNILLLREQAWVSMPPAHITGVATPIPREKRHLSTVIPVLSDLPSVRYHAFHTLNLFAGAAEIVFSQFVNIEHLWLIVRPTDSCLTFSFTSPEVMMQSILWNQLYWQISGRMDDRYDWLRNIGGFIDPLPWDEGAGQGFIIRLPWAKSSK